MLIARPEYLRRKLANRHPQGGTIRPEVYPDESDITVNHSSPRTWYLVEDGPWVWKPSGKGTRLSMLHAMTEHGWVDGAKVVFQAKRPMKFENFRRWFVEP